MDRSMAKPGTGSGPGSEFTGGQVLTRAEQSPRRHLSRSRVYKGRPCRHPRAQPSLIKPLSAGPGGEGTVRGKCVYPFVSSPSSNQETRAWFELRSLVDCCTPRASHILLSIHAALKRCLSTMNGWAIRPR